MTCIWTIPTRSTYNTTFRTLVRLAASTDKTRAIIAAMIPGSGPPPTRRRRLDTHKREYPKSAPAESNLGYQISEATVRRILRAQRLPTRPARPGHVLVGFLGARAEGLLAGNSSP